MKKSIFTIAVIQFVLLLNAQENNMEMPPDLFSSSLDYPQFMVEKTKEICYQPCNIRNEHANISQSKTDLGRIVFVSDRDGKPEIYTINSDGTELQRLTNDNFTDSSPLWSPDGTQIAYVSKRDNKSSIFIMNSNGTEVQRITEPDGDIILGSWSPDGMKIAYSLTIGMKLHIYLVDISGKNQKELCKDAMLPSWSPDSKKIVFNRGNIPQIFIMDSDGLNIKPLLSSQNMILPNLLPIWSPDGNSILLTKVILAEGSNNMNYEICIVDKQGESLKQLTNYSGWDMAYSWNPNGKQFVFVSDRDGNMELYKMNVYDSTVIRLTNNPASDTEPSWSSVPAEIK